MATTYDKASLVMIPSGVKESKLYSIKPTSGDGDFTFSRGTDTATRVNSSGLIEKERGNILLQSNAFDNASWTKSNASVTANTAVAPDGTTTADTFTITANFGTISQAPTYASGQVSTYSVYVKNIDAAVFNLQVRTATTAGLATFNFSGSTLTSSTLTTGIAQGFTDEGNGWYRCFVTFVTSETNQLCRLQIQDSGDSVYVWAAQLEQGLVATDYIETTTAAVYEGITDNLPRLDYSGGASCPSLLLEPSRTNVVEYAEYFDIYSKNNATITNNDSSSPEGLINATSIAGDGTTSSHYIYRNSGTAVSGTDYTISFFAKSGSLDYVQIVLGSGAFGVLHQNFDLSNGTIGSSSGSVTPFIEAYTDNWYRVGITITATASTTITPFIALANSSTMSRLGSFATSSDVKIYGLQIEAGSYPTSYIPTYGTSASRARDEADITSASALIGSEGVMFIEMQGFENGGASRRCSLSDGTNDNRVMIEFDESNNQIKGFVSESGTTTGITASPYDHTNNNKVALKYTASEIKIFVNGVLANSDSLSGSPIGMGEIHLYQSSSVARWMEGFVKQYLVFPTALTDAECIALTTI